MAAGFCLLAAPPALPAAESLALGQQLMNAVLCTNVVYPVYTRGQYIRHYTPGRWWDCVYTWDSDSLEWVWLRPACAMPLTA